MMAYQCRGSSETNELLKNIIFKYIKEYEEYNNPYCAYLFGFFTFVK